MTRQFKEQVRDINIGAIGYGNIVRTSLLPNIDNASIVLKGVTNIQDKLAPSAIVPQDLYPPLP